jgi:hypothetical protein
MADAAQRRTGLDPLPGRVPPLPGGGLGRAAAGVAETTRTPGTGPERPDRRPRAAYRSMEFQVDSEIRRFLETTALTIRLRTECSFDRSALIRGILRALVASGIDLSDCDSEDDVTAALARYLSPGGA